MDGKITFSSSLQVLEDVSFARSDNNLDFAKNISDQLQKSFSQNDREMNLSSRQFKSHEKSIKKFNSSLANSNSEFQQTITKQTEIFSITNSLHSIQTLPQFLLKLNSLKGYEACQLLVHERGSLNVNSFFYGTGKNLDFSSTSTKKFNDIFNLIKKSKNRDFNQTQILESELNIVGTFLAQEFNSKTHRLVLILSRNDFLPPSSEDRDYFDKLSLILDPMLERFLQIDLQNAKNNHTILLFESLPIPMALADENQNILFQNKLFSDEIVNEFKKDAGRFTVSSLSNGQQLICLPVGFDKTTADIHHHQRVSLLGELLNTLRHELSNPLFGVNLASDLLKSEFNDEEMTTTISHISDNTSRCQTIIKNFSNLYQKDDQSYQINLSLFIKEVITLTKSESRGIKKNVLIQDVKFLKNFEITKNQTWLYQILFNLMINSAQAIASSIQDIKMPTIELKVTYNKKEQELNFTVKDNGPGIPIDLAPDVFDPFFTTKRNGTGLGLSICRNLSHKLGGQLKYQNNELSIGATFTLTLPIDSLGAYL
ncbi:MAG: HAMP domain-containing histidine kinase [Halobacteriovoraceae bacterium]|nr:HAMP domain-containing histidine kinase [Halobacteriovoraceae bacterium]